MQLEKLLSALAVDVEPFAVCEVRHGWSVSMPPAGHVTVHFNLEGDGVLHVPGADRYPFGPNTMLVVPQAARHRIELAGETAGHELDAAVHCAVPTRGLTRMVAGEASAGVLMVCGTIRATYADGFGVFDSLQRPLVVTFDSPHVRAAFDALMEEQARPGPGTTAMMQALMTQCLVAMFRQLCEAGDCQLTWLSSLDDERIGRAVDKIVDAPADAHSVESLAKLAGMSRSAFSERFGRLFGRAPMEFVREVRLRRGAKLLRQTDLPVKQIAEDVGFSSRSHFSRAFRSAYGIDPAGFRASAGSTPAPT